MGRSENADRFSKNADRFQKNADRFFSMEACWRKSCRTFGKVVQLLKKLYGFSASALLSELKKHALAREARRMCEGYVKVSGDGKVEGLWRLWYDPSPPECRCTGALRAVSGRWKQLSPKPSVTVKVHFHFSMHMARPREPLSQLFPPLADDIFRRKTSLL